jgi:hypothetical protein
MKDENAGVIMTKFIGLRSKMYAIALDDNSHIKKAKGIKKMALEKLRCTVQPERTASLRVMGVYYVYYGFDFVGQNLFVDGSPRSNARTEWGRCCKFVGE